MDHVSFNLLKKEKTMTITGRFGPMILNQTLGFENFIRDVESILNDTKPVTNFPPHNIIKLDENKYVVELAVAGFGKDEIDIQVQENTLTIKGEKSEGTPNLEYLHRGIGTRSFTKTITIADTIHVKGAEFKDGILRVGLENIIPEHKKPRKIEISSDYNALKEFKPQLLQEEKKAA
jgi:molecular chaperone IbpA